MGSVNIRKFIDCHSAAVFEVNDGCPAGDPNAVPCRFRVGYRRILTTHVRLDQLSLTLWQEKNRIVMYHPGLPVVVGKDKHGFPFVDTVALVQTHLGTPHEDDFTYSNIWRWEKNTPESNTFLTTPLGVASTYTDTFQTQPARTQDTLYFAPGALTLCGHEVRILSWAIYDPKNGSPVQTMHGIAEQLLSNPHRLSAEEFLSATESLNDLNMTDLKIHTNRGTYDLCSFRIDVKLADQQPPLTEFEFMGTGFQLNGNPSPAACTELALQLMQADSFEAVHVLLEKQAQAGLVRYMV